MHDCSRRLPLDAGKPPIPIARHARPLARRLQPIHRPVRPLARCLLPIHRHVRPLALLLAVLLALALCACEDSPVMRLVVSETAYADIGTLDRAEQPESLMAGAPVHASVHVIESPEGMVYTIRWLLDGEPVFSQQQATTTGPSGVLVFPLEGALVKKGTLTVQILFRDMVLSTMDVPVK